MNNRIQLDHIPALFMFTPVTSFKCPVATETINGEKSRRSFRLLATIECQRRATLRANPPPQPGQSRDRKKKWIDFYTDKDSDARQVDFRGGGDETVA